MSYGPKPWQQTQWDWRAAGNFIGGGFGGGLIACAAAAGLRGTSLAWTLLAGIACVGAGLSCVWLEIGRPLRAMNVFRNPGTSWMSREAIAATLLMPVAFACAVLLPVLAPLAALLALVFVYCQSRMLGAARGIPTWREPALVPLVVASGLADGAGLTLLLAPAAAAVTPRLLPLFAALLLARAAAWFLYRRRLGGHASARALRSLDTAAGWLLSVGTLAPLAAVAWDAAPPWLLGAAGLLAAGCGAGFKLVLVTRAGFNQGFSLTHLPVRGVAR